MAGSAFLHCSGPGATSARLVRPTFQLAERPGVGVVGAMRRAGPVRRPGSAWTASAAVAWGPLGPAEAAEAFRIYYLPFVEPLDIDSAIGDQLLGLLGPATPIFLGLIALWIQGQINNVRREQEGKVASAAAGAVAGAVGGAAKSAAGNIGERLSRVTGEQWLKLLVCLAIDLAGNASFLLPGLGELGDAAYAPLEGVALKLLFGGNLLPLLGFAEEALPFTDAVPTATSAWVLQSLFPDSFLSQLLGIAPPQPPPAPPAPADEPKKAGESAATPSR